MQRNSRSPPATASSSPEFDAGALTLGASDSGTISGFGYGDKIVFKSATYSAAEKVAVVADASNPGDDTVTITNGAKTNPSTIASFTVAGDYTAANFTLGKAAGGGIAVGYKIGTGGQLIGEGSDAETVTVAQYLANQSLLDKDFGRLHHFRHRRGYRKADRGGAFGEDGGRASDALRQ